MKQLNLFIVTLLIGHFIQAQSVGIGTTTPDAKSQLDIRSTTKGLLIPSMTTSQRLAITVSTPGPNGLLVYDTDRSQFYHYTGTTWTPILNGDYWSRPVTSRSRIVNVNDSIGIGTISPTEWLDVDGNIRSRNNLLVDNNITALGTSLLSGDVTTNSDLIINNSTATLQLKSSSVNKGYFQLSGDNVRMGTNSGNSTGNLIIRMNGSDRVTVNAAGDIDLDGKITRSSVTGANSLLPVCFGLIDDAGTILSGSGNFTVSHTGEGVYRITCNQLTSLVISLATPLYTGFYTSALQFTANSVDVRIHRPGPILTDGAFSFLIYRAY